MKQTKSFFVEVWWNPLSWLLNVVSATFLFWDKVVPGDWPGRLPVISFFHGIHWLTRIAVLLVVNILVILMGARSAIRERDTEIDQLQNDIKPPDLAIACSGFPSYEFLTVSNAGPGTAHNITVEQVCNCRVYSEPEPIDFIQEGTSKSYRPRVYLKSSKELGEMGFGSLLNAAYNARPPELETTKPTVLSMCVTHFDATNRKFESEFEVRYTPSSAEINISLKTRRFV